MNARAARPLLGIVLSGALLLGGGFAASPALAADATATPSGITPSTVDAPRPASAGHTGAYVPTNEPAPKSARLTRPKLAADDPADPVPNAPTGSYTLSTGAAWVGQTVRLTELSVSDPALTRTVNWGDGSAPVTLAAGETTVTKSYAAAGEYPVSVTLTDAAGGTAQATVDQPLIAVTLPGRLQVNKTAVWLGQSLRVTISGVQPGFTSKIVLDWGDGYTNTFPGTSGYVDGYYYHRRVGGKRVSGVVTLRAWFYNKLGAVVLTTNVSIRPDGWRPAVKVNKPAKSNRASSWAYVRGTASDKGSGLNGTYVWVTKITGKKVYCYTPSKKWKRVYNQTQLDNCAGILAKVTKGKWAVRILGLKKGSTVYVDALSWDWSDNRSKQSSTHAKLTR